MKNQLFDSKLWKAITAVASGIMTSLLYDLLSSPSYVLHQEGVNYILTPDGNNAKSTFFSIIFILLLFLFLWGVFTAIILIGSKISKQLRFREPEYVNGKKLVATISEAKKKMLLLKDIYFCHEHGNITNIDFISLHLTELATIICSLHKNFIPCNKYRKSHMKDYFRHPDYSSIINITDSVSKYELLALIELLNKMVEIISSYNLEDELIDQDCGEMKTMLKDLKDVADSIN